MIPKQKLLIKLLSFEIAGLPVAYIFCLGSTAKLIFNVFILQLLVLLCAVIAKFTIKLALRKPTDLTLSTRDKILGYAGAPIILILIGFSSTSFQTVEKYVLSSFGSDTTAAIRSHRYYANGGGIIFPHEVSQPQKADDLSLDLSFGQSTTTVIISKYDSSAQKISETATNTGIMIPVRYLLWFPQIALPKIMLDD